MKAVVLGVTAGLAALAGSSAVMAETANLEISGLLEVEAGSGEDFSGAKTTDINLATVELAIDSKLNERVSAHVAFLYEEGATPFDIDEGTLTLDLGDAMAFTAGKMYVPFGRYDSFMISDPQTLVLGETAETVLMLSGQHNGVYGFAYMFNGDSDKASEVAAGDNTGISGGFNLGYAQDERFDVGVSYISNIGDTNTLQELESSPTTNNVGAVDSTVAGASVYFNVSFGNVRVLGEHVMALESFTNGDLDNTVQNKEQPSASNLEVGVDVADGVTVAAAYQKTAEAQFIGLPETVVSASVAYEVAEGTTLSAEYASQEDYGSSDGGTGNSANSLTMKLAVEF